MPGRLAGEQYSHTWEGLEVAVVQGVVQGLGDDWPGSCRSRGAVRDQAMHSICRRVSCHEVLG